MGSGSSAQAQKQQIETKRAVADETIETKCDPRLPYANFRELFTLKNYWKTIRRNDKDCAKTMFAQLVTEFIIYFLT